MSDLVERLAEICAEDLETVGGKGANLGELVRAHFRVPDACPDHGGVPACGQSRWRGSRGDPPGAADRLRTAPVPEAIATAEDLRLSA